ncbi:MAG TPA: tRNA-(ms[2]io[6]A)-hydroxylase [Bacteroidia bacterium]|nr:tRNA-(ms[2]io[6]A)-hydroxylase [Bacteroidia bacterium]
MKLSLDLKYETPKAWADAVMTDFNSFLQDHADCERKASAMALSFVAKCPDKVIIIPWLIETALEELEHFQQVYKIMEERGVQLKHDMPQDIYIKKLLDLIRIKPPERLLDRLLLASIIECRGTERFRLVAEALDEGDLKTFYKMLWASEAKHGNIFVKMALEYYDKDETYKRLEELTEQEGKICASLPLRPALH